MEVTVSGRHTTVSENLRQQAVEKIGRLDRYLSGMDYAEVHFWEEKNPRKDKKEFCEVTLEGHGHHVRTKVSAPDGFTAIDLAVDKLERQLRKLKTKVNKGKKGSRRPELPPDLVPETLLNGEEVVEPIYKIAKTKTFDLATMDPESAALQMDLLNHDFYLFTNGLTGRNAVVYRRDEGDIGLIDITPPD
jgi:putative sigma-54 modulation protein